MARKIFAFIYFSTFLFNSNAHTSELKPSLNAYSEWAATQEELPKPAENDDLLNPDYSEFHENRKPGRLKRFLSSIKLYLGLEAPPMWSVNTFTALLEEMLQKRISHNLHKRHALIIRPPEGSHFYVFGRTYGAFHSLLRDLNELKKRNIIDDQFKITQKNTYLVFNGNQIDRSPYNLETLTILMTLMKENEGKAIYISGRHEFDGLWHDYGTGREIGAEQGRQIGSRIEGEKNQILNLKMLSKFFATLPESLFILDSNKIEYHALKLYARQKKAGEAELNIEPYLDQAPKDVPAPIWKSSRKAVVHNTKKLVIDATIGTIDRSISFRKTEGLEMTEPNLGAISWVTLSSPTRTYQQLFEFYYDAFVYVKINKDIKNSTISLINQDVRKMNGFKAENRHILSGKLLTESEMQTPPSMNDYPTAFGSLYDLSGASSILGRRLMSGVNLRFRKQNRESGGFDGGLLRLFKLDDRSSTSKALQNVANLRQNFGVKTLIVPAGIGSINALVPQIEKGDLTVFFPNSGANSIRRPDLKNLINLRTSYVNESCALVQYAVEELHQNKFAIVYQNDEFGNETLAASKSLLENRYKFAKKNICEIPFEPDSNDMEETAKMVRKCLPDAILLLSTFVAADTLIQTLGVPFLAPRVVMGLSSTTDALRNYPGLQIIISRVVPNPADTNPPLVVKRYKAQMDEEYSGAYHNPESLEAYIATSLLIRTMERLKSPITSEMLLRHFESYKDVDHQGLKLNFNPKTRELLNSVWLDIGSKQDWIEKTPADKLCEIK